MDFTTTVRKLRRSIASLAVVAIVASLSIASAVSAFSDVSSDAWYYTSLQNAVDAGVIDGTATTFRPGASLNRAEAATIVVRAAGVQDADLVSPATASFKDVASSFWGYKYIETAKSLGIIKGYADQTFKPGANVTRAEFAVMAKAALELETNTTGAPHFSDVAASHWAYEAVETGYNWSVFDANAAGFRPNASITRSEVVAVVDRAMSPVARGNNPGTPGTTTGPVSVSLAATTPAAGGAIVAGQATAPLLAVTFTGNGTVNSVTLKRGGVSDQNTLSNVYLYDGVTRLTDGYTFNAAGVLTMNNLGIQVNGSKTITVTADVDSATTSYNIFVSLVGFTAGTSASAVNVQGNSLAIASGSSLASVTFTGDNSVAAATVNAGTAGYAVWRQVVQVNTRALLLKAANFRVSGSAPVDALVNVGLYIDGVKAGSNAASVVTNGSNYLSFDLTTLPVSLTTGSHTVELRGDVVKGSSYNFTVALQQASDLMIFDPQVGVNLAVSSFTASTAGQITIGAGSVTISIDPTFSAMTNVVGGASNAVIAKFKVHGYGEDVKVTTLPVTPVLATCTPTCDGLQNLSLYFNGAQVGSQHDWTSGAYSFSLGSQLVIPAGADSTLEVRADLRTADGDTYTAGTVSANLGAGTAEGWNSKASVSTPTATGTSLTIQTGALGVAKNTGFASQTQNPNTAGAKLGSYVLQNQSSSESVRVTSLVVSLTTDGTTAMTASTDPALTNFSGLRTSETSGTGSIPVQPQASNTFSVDFMLAPGATKVIDIFADTGAATGDDVVTKLAVNALGTPSNTAIAVAAVTGQTIALSSGTVATPTLLTASSTTAQYVAAGDPSMSGSGAVDGTKATFNFVSTGGSSTISELKFTISGTATTPVMSVRVGNVSAPVVSNVAWLQGLNLAVPNGGAGLTIDAFVTYGPVGTSGAAPATTAITTLTYMKYTSGGTTTPEVISVAAPTMTLVGSKPTVTNTVLTTSGLNFTTNQKIGEVSVAADAKGNIKINDIKFSVGSTGFTTLPTFTNAKLTDGSTTAIAGSSCGQGTAAAASQVIFCEFGTGTLVTTTGVANVESNTDYDGYTIAAGTSKTFSLYADVSAENTGTNSASISTSLNAAGFNWDDTSTNGVSGTDLSGTLIYNFPSGSYTIKQ